MKKCVLNIFVIILMLISSMASAMNVDSLIIKLNAVKEDTSKALIMNDIGWMLRSNEAVRARSFLRKSIELSEKNKFYKGLSDAFNIMGLTYYAQSMHDSAFIYFDKMYETCKITKDTASIIHYFNNKGLAYVDKADFDKALNCYNKSLQLGTKINNLSSKANTLNNIGLVYFYKGEYPTAIQYYFDALEILKKANSNDLCGNTLFNIGAIYYFQEEYEKASQYYQEAAPYFNVSKNHRSLFSVYTGLGAIFDKLGNTEKALEIYTKALESAVKIKNEKYKGSTYTNLGILYKKRKVFSKSIECLRKGIDCNIIADDKRGLAISYYNLSNVYNEIGNPDQGVYYGKKCFDLCVEIGMQDTEKDISLTMAELRKQQGNPQEALVYLQNYKALHDSLFDAEKTKVIEELHSKYDSEQKQLEIENLQKEELLQKAEIEMKQEELKRQRMVILIVLISFVVFLGFSVSIYRQYSFKKKANAKLNQQNEEIKQKNEEIEAQRDEISAQKELVAEQRDQITDIHNELKSSILYAKRIQNAIIPDIHNVLSRDSQKELKSDPSNLFLIFRPKDVVSGDFYWATKTEEWSILTVADCTGHGVPGAFMSMLGISFLNEIVRKKDVTNSAEILNQLRSSVINALKQTGESGTQKDGMDMSVIAIHKDRKKALWAGANNPLWIIRAMSKDEEVEIEEIKPDKMPVAVHVHLKPFTNHEIALNPEDRLYLFSDGFPDQFGGEKGKKYMYKRFREKLAASSDLEMTEQGLFMEKELDDWMNFNGKQYEQVDDITVLGVKL